MDIYKHGNQSKKKWFKRKKNKTTLYALNTVNKAKVSATPWEV